MDASANDNMVAPEHACPLCGERDADRLVWQDDERVECQMCGTVYAPGRRDDEHRA
ncbi:MAG: hypothetical protein ACF8R9_10950 [Phycisphaerales bacterium JB054]